MEMAEQELANVITASADFFDSEQEKEAALQRIRQNPEAILTSYEKPFMKKIAKAMMAVKEDTPFTKALAEQRAFMDERLTAERKRTEELLATQEEYFEGKLAAEIIRMERVYDDHKRMMTAAFALLSDEIELKGEHIVNLSKLLKRVYSDEEWVNEIDKCVPR